MHDSESNKRIIKESVSWILVLAGAFAASLLISNFVIVNATVPTGSMRETIKIESRIVANRLSYKFSDPKRFDVIVFKNPDDERQYYVKRIIGLPGEKLEIRSGKVYINGSEEPLDDSFVVYPHYDDYSLPTQYNDTVPEGCYFMMGDNRGDSKDSRMWRNTFLERSKILGRVVFSYYPRVEFIK